MEMGKGLYSSQDASSVKSLNGEGSGYGNFQSSKYASVRSMTGGIGC